MVRGEVEGRGWGTRVRGEVGTDSMGARVGLKGARIESPCIEGEGI